MAPTNTSKADAGNPWRAKSLLARPGFLIRRLHQVHVALFLEECAGHDITPVQYSLLTELAQHGECEQAEVARALGIDRTNIADVAVRLERRGLLARRVNPSDKRSRLIVLTDAGAILLEVLDQCAERAHARTVEALPKPERDAFVRALSVLVEAGNPMGRATLKLR